MKNLLWLVAVLLSDDVDNLRATVWISWRIGCGRVVELRPRHYHALAQALHARRRHGRP